MSKRKRDDSPTPQACEASEGSAAENSVKSSRVDRELTEKQAASTEGPAVPQCEPVKLSELKFSKPLSGLTDLPRKACDKCGKRRKYYCYDCVLPIYPDYHACSLALPLQLYIYKHFNERNSKSTAIHAGVVSPDAHICTYPDLGCDLDPETTLLVYPTPDSHALSEVPDLPKFKNVVVVEATWQQSKSIARDPKVCQYTKVRLNQHRSIFWRYQDKDETYLATIEAIYFFFVEYHNAILAGQGATTKYDGEYDDLLFFYSHMYQTIQNAYKADRTLEFTKRSRLHAEYIRYDEDPLLKGVTAATATTVATPSTASTSGGNNAGQPP